MAWLIVAPAELPINPGDAELRARVTSAADATVIADLVSSAVAWVEQRIGQVIMPQTWEETIDGGFPELINLAPGRVTSIVSVSYVNPDGVATVLDPATYVLDQRRVEGVIHPVTAWPVTASVRNAVRVRWGAGAGCSPDLRAAILMLVVYWFDTRGAATEGAATPIPFGVETLLAAHRRFL